MKGRTTIVIAHRLSTIKRQVKLFLLIKDVTGEGTHDELMKYHEKYHQFVTTQNLNK